MGALNQLLWNYLIGCLHRPTVSCLSIKILDTEIQWLLGTTAPSLPLPFAHYCALTQAVQRVQWRNSDIQSRYVRSICSVDTLEIELETYNND